MVEGVTIICVKAHFLPYHFEACGQHLLGILLVLKYNCVCGLCCYYLK